jgi:hypothetical protein
LHFQFIKNKRFPIKKCQEFSHRLRTKRTGIAVTDEMQIIASGLTTIPSQPRFFLKDYFAKEKVEAVLIKANK